MRADCISLYFARLYLCDSSNPNCQRAVVLALAERTQNGHLRESLPLGYATVGQCNALLALYKNGSSYLSELAKGRCAHAVTCVVVLHEAYVSLPHSPHHKNWALYCYLINNIILSFNAEAKHQLQKMCSWLVELAKRCGHLCKRT